MAKVEAAPELVRVGGGRSRAGAVHHAGDDRHRAADGAGPRKAFADRGAASCHDGCRRWQAVTRRRIGAAWCSVRGADARRSEHGDKSGQDLALVVGYAGTGKSAMLGVARATWEAARYHCARAWRCRALPPRGLEAGSGIVSRTIASLEYAWQAGAGARPPTGTCWWWTRPG